MTQRRFLVSACLAGVNCRYDGRHCRVGWIAEAARCGRAIPVCPEEAGGLGTPREPARIICGTGADVLEGRASVATSAGVDVTREYLRGAKFALSVARREKLWYAVLKSGSPSCGPAGGRAASSGSPGKGEGVTAALLRQKGLRVVGVREFLRDSEETMNARKRSSGKKPAATGGPHRAAGGRCVTNRDVLWAPWRMGYILKGDREGCFLCRAFRTRDARRHFRVHKGRRAFVLLNIYPYNNGHLMVAPARHKASLEDMDAATGRELFALLRFSVKALRKVLHPHGFNIGLNLGRCSGAGLKDHLHFHVVPRWEGDTNFMSVVSHAKVIPQSLDEVWELLRQEFLKF